MEGRVDFPKYKSGLRTCLNHIPLVQGGATRRPGTMFVNEVKDSSKVTRLIRFQFSTTQAYILEFGNLYVRIYRNHAQVVSGGAVEITTPYVTADLPSLMVTQSADVLYIAHASYAPRKISRTSDTAWTITQIAFLDGPYLPINTTPTTMSSSATGPGVTTITASSIVGINGGIGFQTTDVGRPIRMKTPGSVVGWGTITARTDTLNVTANLVAPVGAAATTTTNWRLGKWSDTTGYPACVTFYQDRLFWGGSTATPEALDSSVTSDYENYQPTDLTDQAAVADNNALSFTLNSDDVQNVRWMLGDANGLLIGTVGGEWAAAPSNQNEALTPTNVKAVQMTSYGVAALPALRVGYTTLFLQKSLRKLREMSFVYIENRYHAPDMTSLAQHITLGGVTQMAFQQEPNSILWAVRADGVLLGFTYERDQEVTGWHRHQLGGTSDAIGTGAKVESVATIPAPDGTRDEVWVIVQRWVGGVVKRYIEVMTKIWEHGDTQAGAWFVDCGLQYSGVPTKTISGVNHLIGESVAILADGAVQPPQTVSNTGTLTLTRAASTVQVGYAYNSDGETMRNDAGAADGTAQGKTQRIHRVNFRVLDTLGLSVGPDFDHLTARIFRTGDEPLGTAVPLFTGDNSDRWEGDYGFDTTICWRFSQPLPGTMLMIAPQQMTQDR